MRPKARSTSRPNAKTKVSLKTSLKQRNSVQIVEVALRDGLQNESMTVSILNRTELAIRLIEAGTRRMELGAFVRPDRVPQMTGSGDVIEKIVGAYPRGLFSALVPNTKGMLEAIKSGIPEIAVFTAASESFTKANINCTIDESFERFEDVIRMAKKNKIKVRGYLSTCFGCPFEGPVKVAKVVKLAERLLEMGCYEVSIGDTIGVGNPEQVTEVFKALNRRIPLKRLAGHFHDTRGTALANILRAYDLGVRIFDSSLGGLGGCPYAPGAAGNVSTEDVVYMFEGMGVKTGLDLSKLIQTNQWFSEVMDKQLPSKMARAGLPVKLFTNN